MTDPALVQAARELGLELAAYGCNAFHGAGQSCLNVDEGGEYCKWCRRIAAFGAAQRAEFEPVVKLLSEALGKYAYPGLTPEWAAKAHGALLALRAARPEGT